MNNIINVILKSGNTYNGRIVEETETTVVLKGISRSNSRVVTIKKEDIVHRQTAADRLVAKNKRIDIRC